MNETRNNTWVIGLIAVLVALLVAMCACMFGLAIGVGIGQARARAQIENIFEFSPEGTGPVHPDMPVMPGMPAMPTMPDMPAMPDMDRLMEMMNGAMVSELVAGGPAEQAGIQVGDLILAVDGDPVTPDTSLSDLISAYAPGDEVAVTVVHMGRGDMSEEEIVVVLGGHPDDELIGFLGVLAVPFFSEEGPGSP